MKIGDFELEEVESADGIKTYKRKDAPKQVSYETEYPWIHLHYMTDDETSDAEGYSQIELCCHACATSLWLTLDWPLAPGAAKPVRDRFVSEHNGCEHKAKALKDPLGMFEAMGGFREAMKGLCPVERKLVFSVSYRGKKIPR